MYATGWYKEPGHKDISISSVVFAGFAIVTNRHTCTDHGTLTLAVGCILIMVLDAA